jgi:hypothetical protein
LWRRQMATRLALHFTFSDFMTIVQINPNDPLMP